MKRLAPYIVLLLVSAIWGAHAVVGASVIAALSPLALATWRFTLTTVLYTPVLATALRRVRTLSGGDWGLLLAASLCSSVLYPLFYYQSLTTLPPVESLLIVNAAPVLAALFGFLLYRETLSKGQVLGLVVALAGVVIIASQAAGRGAQSMAAISDAAIGTAAFALYTVLSRRLFRRLPLFDVLALTALLGALMLWTVLVATRTFSAATALPALNAHEWFALLFIVIFVSTIAYILYGYGLARLSAGVSAALTFYPQVVFAALLQWIWLGRAITLITVAGGAVILAGSVLMQRFAR